MRQELVTVFGGSGFIGRNIVRALARNGYRIRVACRYPNKAFFLRPMGSVGQIAAVKCDVTEPEAIAGCVEGSASVINLTGILYRRGRQRFETIHAEAPRALAEAAARAGVRTFVHISAIGADPQSESAYASSKAEGEAHVRAAFPNAAIVRPSIVFGPEDSFFNRFAALARISPVLPLVGGGATRFQPVFVGDVAKAVALCAGDPLYGGRTYEVGGPAIYTFRELMEIVLREIGRRRLLLPLPFPLATLLGGLLQFLPNPLLTPDQVRLLKIDNVVTARNALETLGIVPTSVEAEVPAYLWRFRPKGQYDRIERERITGSPAT